MRKKRTENALTWHQKRNVAKWRNVLSREGKRHLGSDKETDFEAE